MIFKYKKVVKEIEKNIYDLKEKETKLFKLKDYTNFIKLLCKDENLKQYAISYIIPSLNRKTNSYLSEVDFNFYLMIDKWLDIIVKGPGISNEDYNSLSSGEQRGIDLALQLAFLDIKKMQTTIVPDILFADEILDGSIESENMKKIMKIIRNKQKDENLKVFIISHRKEINDIDDIDNLYMAEKKDGYSILKKCEF
jgi:ABC-type multidrug transport system ATPase subunit